MQWASSFPPGEVRSGGGPEYGASTTVVVAEPGAFGRGTAGFLPWAATVSLAGYSGHQSAMPSAYFQPANSVDLESSVPSSNASIPGQDGSTTSPNSLESSWIRNPGPAP